MDYWKEAEKIYTDLERKEYRIDFESGSGDGYGYSSIRFREKGTEYGKYLCDISFGFQIEDLFEDLFSFKLQGWELEDNFMYPQILVYDRMGSEPLIDFLIDEFGYNVSEINRRLRRISWNSSKLYYFYVMVAEKHYSSVFSKVKNSIGKEG
ncbi:hypothetical protein [Enterococcus cecorum]|uniref:hypothetical protein n=1 Tax=Enterococcus cecorum TaxID=44008 RepID=UPI0032C4AA41